MSVSPFRIDPGSVSSSTSKFFQLPRIQIKLCRCQDRHRPRGWEAEIYLACLHHFTSDCVPGDLRHSGKCLPSAYLAASYQGNQSISCWSAIICIFIGWSLVCSFISSLNQLSVARIPSAGPRHEPRASQHRAGATRRGLLASCRKNQKMNN